MTVIFTAGEALELVRYGKFTLLSLSVDIPASEAVTISPPYPFRGSAPSVEAEYHIKSEYLVLTERFNWGDTSRPNKVYYELHEHGFPFPRELTKYDAPEYREGFYCGTSIKECNIDNQCTHIYAGDKIKIKLWNATASDPQDVWVEFTVWYYTFRKTFFPQVYEILTKDWMLLEKVINLLEQLHKDLTTTEIKKRIIPGFEVEEAIERATDPRAR